MAGCSFTLPRLPWKSELDVFSSLRAVTAFSDHSLGMTGVGPKFQGRQGHRFNQGYEHRRPNAELHGIRVYSSANDKTVSWAFGFSL